MVSFVTCSKCKAQSPVQPEANAVRCGYCHTVTRIPNNHRSTPSPRGGLVGRPSGGRKKAVVCGVNHKGAGDLELTGCIHDARSIKALLINRFNFPQSNILLLTEEEKDKRMIPTRDNIIAALHWLVQGVRAGDSLVFHFAGHGTQMDDEDGDEDDESDEVICPLDYDENEGITDDELNQILVSPIPAGAKLTAIIDTCHSGTVLDLPFAYRTANRRGRSFWTDHQSSVWKGSSGGEVIAISGCTDLQFSDEIPDYSLGIRKGAMTYCFIQAVNNGDAKTYGSLFNAMKSTMSNLTNTDSKGKTTKLTQEIQLSSNYKFDLNSKLFSL